MEAEIAAALQAEKRGNPTAVLMHYRNAMQRAGSEPAGFADVVKQLSRACQRIPKDAALRHLLGAGYLFERDLRNAEIQLRKAACAGATLRADSLHTRRLPHAGRKVSGGAGAITGRPSPWPPQDRDARLRLAGLLAYTGEKAEARVLYLRLIDEGTRDPLAYAG